MASNNLVTRSAAWLFESLFEDSEANKCRVSIPDTLLFKKDPNSNKFALSAWIYSGKNGFVTKRATNNVYQKLSRFRDRLVQGASEVTPVAVAFGYDGFGLGVPPQGLDNLLADLEAGSLEGITMLQARLSLGNKAMGPFEVDFSVDFTVAGSNTTIRPRLAASVPQNSQNAATLRSLKDEMQATVKRVVVYVEALRRVSIRSGTFEFIADSGSQLYCIGIQNLRTTLQEGETLPPPMSPTLQSPVTFGQGVLFPPGANPSASFSQIPRPGSPSNHTFAGIGVNGLNIQGGAGPRWTQGVSAGSRSSSPTQGIRPQFPYSPIVSTSANILGSNVALFPPMTPSGHPFSSEKDVEISDILVPGTELSAVRSLRSAGRFQYIADASLEYKVDESGQLTGPSGSTPKDVSELADSLCSQLKEYQVPAPLISTVRAWSTAAERADARYKDALSLAESIARAGALERDAYVAKIQKQSSSQLASAHARADDLQAQLAVATLRAQDTSRELEAARKREQVLKDSLSKFSSISRRSAVSNTPSEPRPGTASGSPPTRNVLAQSAALNILGTPSSTPNGQFDGSLFPPVSGTTSSGQTYLNQQLEAELASMKALLSIERKHAEDTMKSLESARTSMIAEKKAMAAALASITSFGSSSASAPLLAQAAEANVRADELQMRVYNLEREVAHLKSVSPASSGPVTPQLESLREEIRGYRDMIARNREFAEEAATSARNSAAANHAAAILALEEAHKLALENASRAAESALVVSLNARIHSLEDKLSRQSEELRISLLTSSAPASSSNSGPSSPSSSSARLSFQQSLVSEIEALKVSHERQIGALTSNYERQLSETRTRAHLAAEEAAKRVEAASHDRFSQAFANATTEISSAAQRREQHLRSIVESVSMSAEDTRARLLRAHRDSRAAIQRQSDLLAQTRLQSSVNAAVAKLSTSSTSSTNSPLTDGERARLQESVRVLESQLQSLTLESESLRAELAQSKKNVAQASADAVVVRQRIEAEAAQRTRAAVAKEVSQALQRTEEELAKAMKAGEEMWRSRSVAESERFKKEKDSLRAELAADRARALDECEQKLRAEFAQESRRLKERLEDMTSTLTTQKELAKAAQHALALEKEATSKLRQILPSSSNVEQKQQEEMDVHFQLIHSAQWKALTSLHGTASEDVMKAVEAARNSAESAERAFQKALESEREAWEAETKRLVLNAHSEALAEHRTDMDQRLESWTASIRAFIQSSGAEKQGENAVPSEQAEEALKFSDLLLRLHSDLHKDLESVEAANKQALESTHVAHAAANRAAHARACATTLVEQSSLFDLQIKALVAVMNSSFSAHSKAAESAVSASRGLLQAEVARAKADTATETVAAIESAEAAHRQQVNSIRSASLSSGSSSSSNINGSGGNGAGGEAAALSAAEFSIQLTQTKSKLAAAEQALVAASAEAAARQSALQAQIMASEAQMAALKDSQWGARVSEIEDKHVFRLRQLELEISSLVAHINQYSNNSTASNNLNVAANNTTTANASGITNAANNAKKPSSSVNKLLQSSPFVKQKPSSTTTSTNNSNNTSTSTQPIARDALLASKDREIGALIASLQAAEKRARAADEALAVALAAQARERAQLNTDAAAAASAAAAKARSEAAAAAAQAQEELRQRFSSMYEAVIGDLKKSHGEELQRLGTLHQQELERVQVELGQREARAVQSARAQAEAEADARLSRVREELAHRTRMQLQEMETAVERQFSDASNAVSIKSVQLRAALEERHAKEMSELSSVKNQLEQDLSEARAAVAACTRSEDSLRAQLRALEEGSVPLAVVQDLRARAEIELLHAVQTAVQSVRQEASAVETAFRARIDEQTRTISSLSGELDELQGAIKRQMEKHQAEMAVHNGNSNNNVRSKPNPLASSLRRTSQYHQNESKEDDKRGPSTKKTLGNNNSGNRSPTNFFSETKEEESNSNNNNQVDHSNCVSIEQHERLVGEARSQALSSVEMANNSAKELAEEFARIKAHVEAERAQLQTSLDRARSQLDSAHKELDRLQSQLQAQRQQNEQDVRSLQQQLESERLLASQRLQSSLDSLRAELRAAFAEEAAIRAQEHAAAMESALSAAEAATTSEMTEKLEQIRKEYSERMAVVVQATEGLEDRFIETQAARQRAELAADERAAAATRECEELRARVRALTVEHEAARAALQASYDRTLEQQLRAAEVAADERVAAISAAAAEREAGLLRRAEAELEQQAARAHADLLAALDAQQLQWRDQGSLMAQQAAAEHARALAEAQRLHLAQIDQLRKEHEETLNSIVAKHDQELQAARKGTQEAVSRARAEAEADKNTAIAAFNAEWTLTVERRVAELLAERDAELARARAEFEQALLVAAERDAAAREAALAALSAELGAGQDQLIEASAAATMEAVAHERALAHARLQEASHAAREAMEQALSVERLHLAEERSRAVAAVRAQAAAEQEEALAALREESERLLKSVESSLQALAAERDSAVAALREAEAAKARQLVELDELRGEIENLTRSGALQRLQTFVLGIRYFSLITAKTKELENRRLQDLRSLNASWKERFLELEGVANALRIEGKALVAMRGDLVEMLTIFKRDALVGNKVECSRLAAEIAELAEASAAAARSTQSLQAQVSESEGMVRTLEREVNDCSKQSVLDKSGSVDVALVRKKKRLDRDMDASLLRLSDRRSALIEMEKKMKNLENQRLEKEKELRNIENDLTATLLAQQKEVLDVLAKIQPDFNLLKVDAHGRDIEHATGKPTVFEEKEPDYDYGAGAVAMNVPQNNNNPQMSLSLHNDDNMKVGSVDGLEYDPNSKPHLQNSNGNTIFWGNQNQSQSTNLVTVSYDPNGTFVNQNNDFVIQNHNPQDLQPTHSPINVSPTGTFNNTSTGNKRNMSAGKHKPSAYGSSIRMGKQVR